MPVYEYKCSKCNRKFDVLHKSTTIQDDVHCPVCDSKENKKLFSKFNSSSSSSGNATFDGCASGSCGLTVDRCPTGYGLN